MRQLIFSLNTWSYTKNIHCCSISFFLFEIIHLPISRHRRRCWCLNCEHIACTFEHDIIHCLTNGDRCKKNMLTSLKWAHCQLVKKSHEIQTTMVVDLCTYLLLDCWLIFAHAGCDNNDSTPCKKIERVLFRTSSSSKKVIHWRYKVCLYIKSPNSVYEKAKICSSSWLLTSFDKRLAGNISFSVVH